MSNCFCYIWLSTTDHGTSVIARIPLKVRRWPVHRAFMADQGDNSGSFGEDRALSGAPMRQEPAVTTNPSAADRSEILCHRIVPACSGQLGRCQ